MNNSVTSTLRLAWASLRILLVLTVVCGVIYPLVVTGIAQGLFHDKANGSEVKVDGKVVGSELIGQSWNTKGTKTPDPKWFQGRPSNSGCDPLATGSSQLGASDPTLVKNVKAALVQDNTTGRTVGFLGEPAVNVLKLNIAVEELTTK
ncbi:potassium-transporting ATPase subunit C [Streptomyces noursei]|uniref:potassium-transporting ATPase subunit C n=1 Tax=Streptomyces noursei TaxID=1971 RepID=UPI0016769518|nr:potassium-transporting ATPase subunit C [Streptomyces noursei]MCZ1013033.1 potassium-transporting ATPase subunit C [Streptomyces noursei]